MEGRGGKGKEGKGDGGGMKGDGGDGWRVDGGWMEVWGAAPRPGRAKFALHPRHVLRTCLSGTRWGPSPHTPGRTGGAGDS